MHVLYDERHGIQREKKNEPGTGIYTCIDYCLDFPEIPQRVFFAEVYRLCCMSRGLEPSLLRRIAACRTRLAHVMGDDGEHWLVSRKISNMTITALLCVSN